MDKKKSSRDLLGILHIKQMSLKYLCTSDISHYRTWIRHHWKLILAWIRNYIHHPSILLLIVKTVWGLQFLKNTNSPVVDEAYFPCTVSNPNANFTKKIQSDEFWSTLSGGCPGNTRRNQNVNFTFFRRESFFLTHPSLVQHICVGEVDHHRLTITKVWHDDVIKWKHFPHNWAFVRGIHLSPVNSPHKGQWLGALFFSFICTWINGFVNNRKAGDLRRHRSHYDISVMGMRKACFHVTMSRQDYMRDKTISNIIIHMLCQ